MNRDVRTIGRFSTARKRPLHRTLRRLIRRLSELVLDLEAIAAPLETEARRRRIRRS